jgi:ABC-type phosphate transport system substrate-binding protein
MRTGPSSRASAFFFSRLPGSVFFVGTILVAMVLAPSAGAQRDDIAVIVNPRNSTTNVSSSDLRNIFAGQKHSWSGGVPIKILVRGSGCRERIVLLQILGMSESEYKQYWTAQVVRGEADSEPPTLPSFGMVKEALKVFPGAIALVDIRDLKPGMEIKILKIDGHLPGEDGYPIH